MPKEERQVDLKTGRVRRKAVFEDDEKENDDVASDEEDDQEEGDEEEGDEEAVSEDGGDGDDENDAEEESERVLLREGIAVRRAKRLKTEMAQEEAVNELPAFADSDDDLEMSSEEEETAPEDSEMEEEEEGDIQRTCEDESSGSESEAANKRADSKQYDMDSEHIETKPQISEHSPKRKAVLTTDSGNCTAEEASESEDENSSLGEGDDEGGSHEEVEAEESNRNGFQHSQAKKADSVRQTKVKTVDTEDDDVENLLREEEEYEEKIDLSADTTGRL